MHYRLVIFDFDGTLADTAHLFYAVVNEIAPRHRFRTVDAGEIEMLRGKGTREILDYLGVSDWRLPLIAMDMRRRAAKLVPQVSLFAGIGELLESLQRCGVVCAVVSSNTEANVRAVLGADAGRIAHFACGAGLYGKAAKFRRVMKRAGFAPEETLCIGDEQRDVEAAQAVGAASGAVTWGYAKRDLLVRCRPTLIVDRPADILAAVGCG